MTPSFEQTLTALRAHRADDAPRDMRAAFDADPARFERFSVTLDDLLFDYSKCAVNEQTMQLLQQLAEDAQVSERREAQSTAQRSPERKKHARNRVYKKLQ